MHRSQLLPLRQGAVHSDSQMHRLSSRHCFAAHHIKLDFYVWVAVAHTRYICQLWVAHLQQLSSLILLKAAYKECFTSVVETTQSPPAAVLQLCEDYLDMLS